MTVSKGQGLERIFKPGRWDFVSQDLSFGGFKVPLLSLPIFYFSYEVV